VPRKSRKDLVGKAEDVDRAERERKLAKLERELHEEHEREAETTRDANATPPDEREENN
jgi:hypothetical protein